MRGACIDIGSNTTRLLVADCEQGNLREVHQQRMFTRISRGLRDGDPIPAAKIAEAAAAVAEQLRTARSLGASEVRAVATAAIRRAKNAQQLIDAVQSTCGLELVILSGEQEARLAFVGATGTLEIAPKGQLGVVDVGGGSTELAVGQAPDRISWSHSFAVGSGEVADECLKSDPPSESELASAAELVADSLSEVSVPRPPAALAVGGSATSLRRLAGEVLDGASFKQTLDLLASAPGAELAARFGLDRERVRLLPAGLLILKEVSRLFATELRIGRGGIREGVLLEGSCD